MSSNESAEKCRKTCWYTAAIAGVILAVLLLVAGDWRFVTAVIAGIVGAIILGAILTWTLCKDQPQEIEQRASTAGAGAAAAGATAAAAASSAAADSSDTDNTPSEPVAEPVTAKDVIADAQGEAANFEMKPSTPLAGEAELAERKGTWRYEAPSSSAGDAATATEAKPAAAPAAAAPAAHMSEDFDGDGVLEGKDEGTRPAALDGPRDGKADDLKQIKGVGPKMEKLLNSLGFYHFDQVAAWTADEVAWVDANLEGFKGRVSRDNWVEQASVLAAGGETEFSKKVEKGGVY